MSNANPLPSWMSPPDANGARPGPAVTEYDPLVLELLENPLSAHSGRTGPLTGMADQGAAAERMLG
jgi:hypothetical protein